MLFNWLSFLYYEKWDKTLIHTTNSDEYVEIGQLVVPEEVFERDIGPVGNGEVIGHSAAGQHFLHAGLEDGHAELGGLIIGGELDDLSGIFQGHVKLLRRDLIISRCGNFAEDIAAQVQRRGRSNAVGVGGDIPDYLSAALTDNLENGSRKSGPRSVSGHAVVLSRVLNNLNLPGDGRVLPLDLDDSAGFHVDGLP